MLSLLGLPAGAPRLHSAAQATRDLGIRPSGLEPGVRPQWAEASEESCKLFDDFVQRGILTIRENSSNVRADGVNPNRLLVEGNAKFREQAVAPEAMILSKERILNMQELPGCPPSQHVAICAIMKNAAPTLPQWLAWHRLLGVGSFYIFDDQSTDNTQEVVAPWVAAGVLKHEPAPDPGMDSSIQLVAYHQCLERFGSKHEWIGFIDADELVQPMRDENECLPAFLNRSDFAQAGSVGLNWMFSGSGDDYILTNEPPARNGGKGYPKEPTTLWDLNGFGNGDQRGQWEEYRSYGGTRSDSPAQKGPAHVKSFCRPSRSQTWFSTPHYCLPMDGAPQLSESAQPFHESWNAPPTNVHMQLAHHDTMSLQYCSWFNMASTLSDDTAPIWRRRPLLRTPERSLGRLEAYHGLRSSPQAAPKSRMSHFQPPGTGSRRDFEAGQVSRRTGGVGRLTLHARWTSGRVQQLGPRVATSLQRKTTPCPRGEPP